MRQGIKQALEAIGWMKDRSGCGRRKIAAVVLDDKDVILGDGVNGPLSCECMCPAKGTEPGSGPSDCYGVHAEIKALLKVHGFFDNLRACRTIVCTKAPCLACTRVLLGTPIRTIIFQIDSNETENREKWEAAGREWYHAQEKAK